MNDKEYRYALVKIDNLVAWLQICPRDPHFVNAARELLRLSSAVQKHKVKMQAGMKLNKLIAKLANEVRRGPQPSK